MAVQASLGKKLYYEYPAGCILADLSSDHLSVCVPDPASGWHRTRCLCRVCGVLFYDDGVSGNSHLRDPRLRRCPR